MTFGPTCGLWPTIRGLVGALVDPDGAVITAATLPAAVDEQLDWLSRYRSLCDPGVDLVITEPTARHEPLGRLALEFGYRVWIAPLSLVTPISRAAWWRPTARQIATLLARLPNSIALRAILRRLPPNPSPSQLCLFSEPLGHARPLLAHPRPTRLQGTNP
jgi:hypothetical protein